MKGLSAAGVEAECCGSSRVQAASQECLCLSACRLSGCGAAGEAKGRQKWCLCSCHVDTSLLPKKSHSLLLNWLKTECYWTAVKNTWVLVPDILFTWDENS